MGIWPLPRAPRWAFVALVLLGAALLGPVGAHATEGVEGDIPGTYLDAPLAANHTEFSGDLYVDHAEGYAESDVYAVWFAAGEVVDFTLYADYATTDFGLRLYEPEAWSIDDPPLYSSDPHYILGLEGATRTDPAVLPSTVIPRTGVYYVRVFTWIDGEQDGGSGAYRLTIDVSHPLTQIVVSAPDTLDWRGYGEITGIVHSRQDELVSGYVELSVREDGKYYQPIDVQYTSDGTFTFGVADRTANADYIVRFIGNGFLNPSSAAFTVKSRAFLTSPVAKRTSYKTYKITGVVGSWHISTSKVRVYLWRYVSGKWRSYGYKNVYVAGDITYSLYSLTYKFPYTGKWRLQAYHSDANHATTKSPYTYVTVK